MRKNLTVWLCALCASLGVVGNANAGGGSGTVLFSENFDSLLPTLGGSVNERVGTDIATLPASDPDSTPIPGVWSATAPGWTVDNDLSTYDGNPTTTGAGVPGQGLPLYGVDEWEGWAFANKDFWSAVDDQRRSEFGTASGASGTVAIADPDEYFDINDPAIDDDGGPDDATNGGYYSSSLTSASFSVSGGDVYGLGFDSSWRDEAFDDSAPGGLTNANNQSVEIIASFDVGGQVQVTKWNSDSADSFFKDDNPDEAFAADGSNLIFEAPAGATSATLSFNLANGGNDWWWAVDNIEVNDLTGTAGTVFSEDFEGVTLGDSVNERLAAGAKVTAEETAVTTIVGTDYPTASRPDSFTHTPPANWSVDNTGTPGAGNDGVGVFEYEQWTFATPEFWQFTDGQGRQDFANGTGVFAIADGDEWDDLNDPGGSGDLTTLMETPEISLASVAAGEMLELTFDSSWRAEDSQTAVVTAVLDGVPTEILRWESDSASAFYHDDNTNEQVAILFDPDGASTLELQFSYLGNDDWWWAIDNVQVATSAVPEPSSIALAALALFGICGGKSRLKK